MPIEIDLSVENIFPGNAAFAPALLDPDIEIPAGMVGPDGKPAPKRFSVYRNNVVVSLMEAMGETFPSVKIILGEENFATVARIFIANHPPKSAMMQAYGGEFPEFLKNFQPLRNSPFVVDVANVEKFWIEAYHALDAQPLDGAQLGAIDPEQLMTIRFEVHPATSLVTSDYALFELFSVRNNDLETFNIEKNETSEGLLITRPQLSVEVNKLDYAGTVFFESIIASNTLGEAIEQAMQLDEQFDASAAITLLLTSGATIKILNKKQ